MSGTIYTSVSSGDWNTAAIWSTDSVPDSSTADVTINNGVTILSGQSFTAGTLDVSDVSVFAALTLVGSLDVTAGTTVDGRFVLADGVLNAGGGLTVDATGILAGHGTITGSIDNTGVIGAGLGVLDFAGPVNGSGSLEIDNGAGASVLPTLELEKGGNADVFFQAPALPQAIGGILQLDEPDAYTGTIFGFVSEGPGIILSGLQADALSSHFSATSTGGTLEITEQGTVVANLTFAGDYTHPTFDLSNLGLDQTIVTVHNVPCFARGTRVATLHGDVAVEDLRVGDRALTASGDPRPIVWIGQRRVDCTRHPRTDLVHPVHIRPDAFAEGRPRRDLFVSPDHALFHDGVLIPVHCLINGATVVQEQAASVHYFHIELDRHDIVLAEGLAAESYLNTGNRAQFENGAAHISLHADFTPRGWDDDHAYAPLCTAGPIVDALNQQLWQRAVALGSSGRDADLQVEVDGRVFRPAAVKGQLHRFLLPASTREARIVSRPGVRIGAILADGGIIGLDTPALAEGFLPLAQSGGEHWRAIDGRARLLLPERFGHAGGVLLEVLLHDTKPSRQSSPPAALAQVA